MPEQEKKKKRPYVRKKSAAFGIDSVSFTQNGNKVEIGLLFDAGKADADWVPAEYATVSVSGQYVVQWREE